MQEGKELFVEIIKKGQPIFKEMGNLTVSNPAFQQRIEELNDKILALELKPEVRDNLMTTIYDEAHKSLSQETVNTSPTERIVTKKNIEPKESSGFDADKMSAEMAKMLKAQGVNVTGVPTENAQTITPETEIDNSANGSFDSISDWAEESGVYFANLYEDFTKAMHGESENPDLTVAKNDDTSYKIEDTDFKIG